MNRQRRDEHHDSWSIWKTKRFSEPIGKSQSRYPRRQNIIIQIIITTTTAAATINPSDFRNHQNIRFPTNHCARRSVCNTNNIIIIFHNITQSPRAITHDFAGVIVFSDENTSCTAFCRCSARLFRVTPRPTTIYYIVRLIAPRPRPRRRLDPRQPRERERDSYLAYRVVDRSHEYPIRRRPSDASRVNSPPRRRFGTE